MSDRQRPMYDPTYTGPRLFGAPVGDFSAFQTVFISLAVGAASFFLGTFLGIVSLLLVQVFSHRAMDYSLTYKWGGLPLGILMLVLTALYLGSLLIRRMTRG